MAVTGVDVESGGVGGVLRRGDRDASTTTPATLGSGDGGEGGASEKADDGEWQKPELPAGLGEALVALPPEAGPAGPGGDR